MKTILFVHKGSVLVDALSESLGEWANLFWADTQAKATEFFLETHQRLDAVIVTAHVPITGEDSHSSDSAVDTADLIRGMRTVFDRPIIAVSGKTEFLGFMAGAGCSHICHEDPERVSSSERLVEKIREAIGN